MSSIISVTKPKLSTDWVFLLFSYFSIPISHHDVEEVEELESKLESRAMHKKIKEITGQAFRKRGSNCIKSKDGKMLFDEDEIKTRWEEYVSELYNANRGGPPEIEDDDG